MNIFCSLYKYSWHSEGENNLCCGWLPVDQLLAAAATTSSAPNGRTNNKYFLLEPISISCRTHFTDMLIWYGIGLIQIDPAWSYTTWCVVSVAWKWFLSCMSFQMSLQMIWISRHIITLCAFVWFFSRVCFQMSPQMACLSVCKVTLATFVRFFSSVSFQMSSQFSCLKRYIVT